MSSVGNNSNSSNDELSASISVLISTFNRARTLEKAILSLARCDIPDDCAVEIVVVDNNSTDETQVVVQKCQAKCNMPVKYVFEPRQGLSYARNAGIAASSGDLLAFTDDDCFVESDWYRQLLSAFRSRPKLAGIGGMVRLYDPTDLPMTIRLQDTKEVASIENLFSLIPGCNMCFRRQAVEDIGLFDVRLGAGTSLMSAEDSDYIYRGIRENLLIEYIPEVCVRHAHGRKSSADAKQLARGYLIGRGAFYMKHVSAGDLNVLRLWFWETRGQFKHVVSGGSFRIALWELGKLYMGALLFPFVALRHRHRRSKDK